MKLVLILLILAFGYLGLLGFFMWLAGDKKKCDDGFGAGFMAGSMTHHHKDDFF